MESFTENSNTDSRATDDNGELDKLKKNYLLLKRKICRTHELIRQYNDKVKECERINQELESTQTELKTLKTTYNGVLGKVIKLEYQNKQYEKKITSMSSTTETQEIQIAGNKQHLHQLSCKLKETVDKCADDQMQWEIEKSVLQEKIKEMERKLKINKNSNSVIKNINKSQRIDKGTNCNFQNLISKVNVAVNTINDSTITRADKDVMTNLSFGNKKNDFYPLFCDKCDDFLFDPAKAICKTMTKHYELIEPISPCRELEEDWENDERSNFQNSSKDQSKSSNSRFELSRISSALREDQIPNVVREELSVNSINTSTETLTHTIDDLKNQMKRLEKKIKKQSYQNWPPNYNYFQVPPPFSNFHNQMCNCSINKSTSRCVNQEYNVNKTSRNSKQIQKRKHKSKARKLNLKKTKCKRVKKIVSASTVVWKVDSIVPCYKQIIRTNKSTSNNHLYRLPSHINNNLILDNGSSFTNVEKDICRNNLIETANGNNMSKLNISSDKPCLSSTIIEEIQPVRDTRSILEPLNIKSNTSFQYETNIVTDKDTINTLDSTRNRASILSTDTSMSNNSNVSDIKKQINISLIEKSDNTENMKEDISNPIDEVPIHVNTSDSISNITENNTISKNRKRKLQIFENKLKKLNLNEDLLISKKNKNSIHNIKSNVMNINETTSENISEKNINNKSNVQTVNTDVVLKKKQRIIYKKETNNQEVSTFSNENINVIKEMDDKSVEIAQANILNCTSLNKKETECIGEQSNNIEVSNKQHRFNINRNPKSKYICTLNKNRIRILRNIKKLRRTSRLYKIGNLKLLDSDEPIIEEDESVGQKKCVPKLKYNKNNIVKINLMKKINKLKVIDSKFIEDFSENTCNNETQIKLTGKSEKLMENVQVPAASSIAISTDINESIKDECFTDTKSPLKDSKLMQNEDAFININENTERENIESCNRLISDEENKMIQNVYLNNSKLKLISPLKKKHISKDMCEKSLENEINEPIQNIKIEPQILNMNEIDTSIHSESNIESQVTGLETSTFIEEETTAEIFNKNMKETKELNLESNKICPDKQDNLIINHSERNTESQVTGLETSTFVEEETTAEIFNKNMKETKELNLESNKICPDKQDNLIINHSERNIESQVTGLETSTFVEEETTAEIFNKNMKETKELNLESNKICPDKQDNLIINHSERNTESQVTGLETSTFVEEETTAEIFNKNMKETKELNLESNKICPDKQDNLIINHSERNTESQVTGLETSTFVEEETTAEIFNKNMKETKELNLESNKICPDKQDNLIINHSERNTESQVTGLETSTFVEEETTAEIFNKNMKETKELNLESNKICPDKQGNLIINTEEPHNSTIITKEKSNELTTDTSINNTKFELISPLKVNQISNDTCASSTENKLLSVSTNIPRIPEQVLNAALVNSKLRKRENLILPKQNKEMKLNKIGKNVSIKNKKVRGKLSKISKNIRKCDDLNIQSCNATVNSSQYVSANSRVNNKHADNNHLNSLVNPIVLLKNYLQQNLHHEGWKKSIQERQKEESLHKKIDKFVYKQLSRIVDNTDWGMSVHRDVVEKLSSTCGARIIANGIVNFMLIRKKDDIDKTYTPPAPIMTAAQQKIVALLVDLEMKVPTVIKWVQDGIEYKIFRLNCTPTFCQIENLIRLYIALTRIQKDREKLRVLCCDALYCLGMSAVSVIYITLTCWPEVLPKFTENNDMLSKCLVHCIMCLQADNFPQLQNLKNYLSMYYNYKKGSYLTKNLVEELLRSFERSNSKENIECLRTAVILLAKKEGVTWTHTNIIKNILLPNIVDRKYAYVQEVFALLGNLMRTFPLEDKDGIVKNIVEQLIDLLDSGEGLHDQQEGVASALLSLSRHDLTKVINCVMKWIPKEPLKSTTMDQYFALFSLRTKAYWKKYLGSVKKVVTQIESKDTSNHNVYNENK